MTKWREVLKAFVFCTLVVLIVLLISPILERKYAKEKMADFFSQKEDFDVLFLGSSHMMNSIYPMELWDKYGIVSYNLGSHNEMLPLSYWNLRLATKYHKPKLAVIDVYGVVKTIDGVNMTEKNLGAIHDSLDAYPISKLKMGAIADLFREKNSLKTQINFLFDFSTYHARWEELAEEDFELVEQTEKGANMRSNVTSSTRRIDYEKTPEANITSYESTKYLRKIINFCKENGIEVLLTLLPFGATTKEQAGHAKYYEKLAKDERVNYLNFVALEPIENQQIDYYDDDHLNASGARKVTEYVGKYIKEKYQITNHKTDEKYKFWEDDYNEYIDFKVKNLKKYRGKREIYLMLLAKEDDIFYEVTVSKDFRSSKSPKAAILLDNLDREYNMAKEAFPGHEDSLIRVVTWDKRDNKKIDEVYF